MEDHRFLSDIVSKMSQKQLSILLNTPPGPQRCFACTRPLTPFLVEYIRVVLGQKPRSDKVEAVLARFDAWNDSPDKQLHIDRKNAVARAILSEYDPPQDESKPPFWCCHNDDDGQVSHKAVSRCCLANLQSSLFCELFIETINQ